MFDAIQLHVGERLFRHAESRLAQQCTKALHNGEAGPSRPRGYAATHSRLKHATQCLHTLLDTIEINRSIAENQAFRCGRTKEIALE